VTRTSTEDPAAGCRSPPPGRTSSSARAAHADRPARPGRRVQADRPMSPAMRRTPSANVIRARTSSPRERRSSVGALTRREVDSGEDLEPADALHLDGPGSPTRVTASTPTESRGATASKAKRTRSSGRPSHRCPRSRGSPGPWQWIRRGGAREPPPRRVVAGGSSSVGKQPVGQSLGRRHGSPARPPLVPAGHTSRHGPRSPRP